MHTPKQNQGFVVGLLLALTLIGTRGESAAHAAEAPLSPDATAMQAQMHSYFDGEKSGGIWLMGVGAAATVAGTGLLFHQGEFYRGLAYPVLIVGVLELLGGAAFYVNTKRRVPRFDQQQHSSPAQYRRGELLRLQRVNREMSFLAAVELTLMVAGGTMSGVGALRGMDTLAGVGTGLLLQSTVLFIYDQLAARRALRYTEQLAHFNVGLISGPAGPAGPGLAPRGAMLTLLQTF